ncbi:thioredoxin domain-containing protein [Paraconexibacter antarcticus]|uniref:Thioredoxin domain-containing protein n=1 Tax=Paraconexibacter antarcticus TaxID=2949664 RepID=A0ABY5E198_9ACTN|nr:thioredoxin domain-containing protein [Paraconexibacter antarcticus]UTI66594.1 thioredoxin domain-containing protein [Paraconexibacter antarcticus]
MANALAHETSPYLQQHAGNPVDWLPWGPEALGRAAAEDKPLLVSIGYSACHWCHVMERESFEDPATAAVMNAHFVCVKVDREERPDVDAIAMEYVQGATGHGGWPLNVFLTPGQVPFHGGTYFPPEERQGMPSWVQVLEAVAEAWSTQADEIRAGGDRLAERLSGGARLRSSGHAFDPAALDDATAALRPLYDAVNGGWGPAPKFPAAPTIEYLLRRGETGPAVHTLKCMAGGGINDQVGGGFARYSVDATWTVPHFEKMLYDNALLARAYLHAWQATGDADLRRVCEETLDWALREMRASDGGFFSALDADSEGVEGRFYVWTVAELREVLGPDADEGIRWLGATDGGNFTDPHHPPAPGDPGLNVLEDRGPRPDDETRARIRAALHERRAQRVRPGLDDKRLTAWNALMISALADAGAVLGRPDYREAARATAMFVLDTLRTPEGRLLRTYNQGTAKLAAYLEDHAFLLEAFITLHEATFEARWLHEAIALGVTLLARFQDAEHGGFFSTADDHEQLLARRKDLEDQPIPAGGSAAAFGLLRLGALTGDHRFVAAAEGQLALLQDIAPRYPGAFGHLLQALEFHSRPTLEVAIVGPEADRAPLVAAVRHGLRGDIVLSGGDGVEDHGVPLLAGRGLVGGRAAAYVCRGFACERPVTEPEELTALLGAPHGSA